MTFVKGIVMSKVTSPSISMVVMVQLLCTDNWRLKFPLTCAAFPPFINLLLLMSEYLGDKLIPKCMGLTQPILTYGVYTNAKPKVNTVISEAFSNMQQLRRCWLGCAKTETETRASTSGEILVLSTLLINTNPSLWIAQFTHFEMKLWTIFLLLSYQCFASICLMWIPKTKISN